MPETEPPSGKRAGLAAQMRQVAIQEGRTPAQLTVASLKFYLDLPSIVRTGLRDVDTLGAPEDWHNLLRAISRAVAFAQYEVARGRVAEDMQLNHGDRLDTDEAILAEAVRATTAPR